MGAPVAVRRQFASAPASQADLWLAAAIVALFLAIGTLTITQYGLTWDEPENLVVGERYLALLSTGDPTFLDFSRSYPAVDNPDGLHLRLLDSHVHPPLPNLAAAVTGRVFGRWAQWLDPVDARHVAVILTGGLVLGVTYLFACEAFGRSAAVVATLTLMLFPRFVGHSHYNLKDIPKTFLFTLTLWGLWRGVVFRRPRWILGGGLSLGIGLSIRPNLIIAATVGILWLMASFRNWWGERSLRLALLAVPLAAAIGFVGAWPAMWISPVATARRIWEYWAWVGLVGRQSWTPYPFLALAFTTPLPTLLLACWGAVASLRLWRSDVHRSLLLLWLWLGLALLRASMPGMNVYDGIRHFLEVAPALALMAALGAMEVTWLVERSARRWLCQLSRVGGGLLLLWALADLVHFAPYETSYFNWLIGGLPGAQAAGVRDATDYWGSSYRSGFGWINEHAPYASALYLPAGQVHLATVVHGLWIRDDVILISKGDAPEGQIYVMHTTRQTEYDAVDTYCRAHLRSVHEIAVDGAVILEVFQLSREEWDLAWE